MQCALQTCIGMIVKLLLVGNTILGTNLYGTHFLPNSFSVLFSKKPSKFLRRAPEGMKFCNMELCCCKDHKAGINGKVTIIMIYYFGILDGQYLGK